MHRATPSDKTIAAASANGSLTPLFSSSPRAAAPDPAELRSARPPLNTPKSPQGDFSPPVPQGSGGIGAIVYNPFTLNPEDMTT